MPSYQPADGSSHAFAFFHLLALSISLTMDMAVEMLEAATFKTFSTNFNLPIGSSFPPAYLSGAIKRIYQYESCIYDRQDRAVYRWITLLIQITLLSLPVPFILIPSLQIFFLPALCGKSYIYSQNKRRPFCDFTISKKNLLIL